MNDDISMTYSPKGFDDHSERLMKKKMDAES
jgi:hypothetical protein